MKIKARIIRASKATSGISGVDAPGLAVEAELSDGNNIRLYVREGWGADKMAISGRIEPVTPQIMDAVEEALEDVAIRLDMNFPAYMNWVPGCPTDYRYGSFADWQKLNNITT